MEDLAVVHAEAEASAGAAALEAVDITEDREDLVSMADLVLDRGLDSVRVITEAAVA